MCLRSRSQMPTRQVIGCIRCSCIPPVPAANLIANLLLYKKLSKLVFIWNTLLLHPLYWRTRGIPAWSEGIPKSARSQDPHPTNSPHMFRNAQNTFVYPMLGPLFTTNNDQNKPDRAQATVKCPGQISGCSGTAGCSCGQTLSAVAQSRLVR